MHSLYIRKFFRVVFIVGLIGFGLWGVVGVAAGQETPDAPSTLIYLPNIAGSSRADASALVYDFTSDSGSEDAWANVTDAFEQYHTSLTRQGATIEIAADENGTPHRVATIRCVGQGCGTDAATANDASSLGVQTPLGLELVVQLDASRRLVFKPLTSNDLDLDLMLDGQLLKHIRFTCQECTIEVTVDELYAQPTPTSTSTAPAVPPTATATNTPPSQPWLQVFPIPGRIEAENYRAGGQGTGYSDTTSGNSGGAYRNDRVDIQTVQDNSGAYNVGWTTTNEWLAYNVNVNKSGSYRATIRVAAPSSGSRFRLEIDGNNVSGSVAIPATGGWQNWADVPVTIALTSGAHVMRFVVETGGFNVNYYTIAYNDAANPSPTSAATSTPVSTPTPIPTLPSSSTNSIDAGVVINPFRPEMLGVAHANWEHAWGKPFSSQVPGLTQAYRAAGIKLVRYAGGLWANSVGWERLPQRTPYTSWNPTANNYHASFASNVKTNQTYYFHYGKNEIDDLGAFSKNAGVAIIIQVNIANNDPAMWADLVHYANVEHDYKFKYWEIGNELDHDTALGISPEEYATRLAGYIDAMKSVDPSIIIIGGVAASGHDFYRLQDYSGATTDVSHYLQRAAELRTPNNRKVDSVSYHWYQSCNNASVNDMAAFTFSGTPYSAWQQAYSRNWSRIGPERVENEVITPKSAGISQGITELNYDACDFDAAPQNSNHMTALWAADVIGRLAYYGVDFVTWYEGYGTQGQGYPLVYSTPNDTSPTGIVLRPTYYAFFMYGNYFGDQMVQSSSTTNPALAVYASTDSDDPGKLKLMVVNFSNAPIAESLALAHFNAQSAEAYVLANPNPTNMSDASNVQNGGTTINGVVLQNMSVAESAELIQPMAVSVSGGRVNHTFAPYSVTAIIVNGD